MEKKRTVVAVVSDIHAGSRTAIFPRQFSIEGMVHEPSPLQHELHDYWLTCWRTIADMRKGARLVIIVLGDLVDGIHHGTQEIITNSPADQENICINLLDEAMQISKVGKGDSLYIVSGTPAHDGERSQYAERIARDLDNVVPYINHEDDAQKRYVHPRIRGRIGGVLFDMLHDGFSIGRRAWTVGGSLQALLTSTYFECIDCDLPMPDVMISAHIHRYAHRYYEGRKGRIDGFINPSWQMKTAFGYKAAKFNPISDVGMMAFEIYNGEYKHHKFIMEIEQDEVKEL